jgi:hypothetical protein
LRLDLLDAGTPREARAERRHDVATQNGPTIGEEARNAISRILLERVRRDTYPSATEMEMIEQLMPPYLLRDYLNVLLEKVATEKYPSISLMHRISRIASAL